jgi:hypothetical protein
MRAATARRMKARGEAMLPAELVAGTVEVLDEVELVLDALEEPAYIWLDFTQSVLQIRTCLAPSCGATSCG